MGRRLVSFYNSFGEYDLLVIYEAPDETTAAAIVLAAVSLVISVRSRPPCC